MPPPPTVPFAELADLPGASDDYGVLAYNAIGQVLADEFAKSQLSLPTLANVGGYLISAYKLATAGVESGTDFFALFESAYDIAFSLAGDIGKSAMDSVGNSVPLLMDALKIMVGAVDSARAAEEAAQREAKRRFLLRCRLEMETYEPIQTGTAGAFKPADYFTQGDRVGETELGAPIWEGSTGRIPFIGRMLEAMTEIRVGGYYLDAAIGSEHTTRFWEAKRAGRDEFAIAPLLTPVELVGVPQKLYETLSGISPAQLQAMNKRGKAYELFCGFPLWPMSQKYNAIFKQLRQAIIQQSIPERQMKGMTPGDGGSSLWPLYMDMLYSAMHVFQTPVIGLAPGGRKLPPLNEQLMRVLWQSSPSQSQYAGAVLTDIGDQPAVWNQILYLSSGAGVRFDQKCKAAGDWPPEYDRLRTLFGSGAQCFGPPTATLESIFYMVRVWGKTVNPIYGDDIAKQTRMLEETWAAVAEFSTQAIAELPLGAIAGAPTKGLALSAIKNLRATGMITEEQASQSSQQLEQGAAPAAWPVLLAAGALGVVLLRRR